MRNIRILFLLVLILSCKNTDSKDNASIDLNPRLKEGMLFLKLRDTTQTLKVEGIITGYYISENKENIAVEIEMFSNLSIIQTYRLNKLIQKYEADSINLNREAWNRVFSKYSLKPEDLLSSQVYFLAWKANDSVVVDLRGNTETGKYISDTLTMKF